MLIGLKYSTAQQNNAPFLTVICVTIVTQVATDGILGVQISFFIEMVHDSSDFCSVGNCWFPASKEAQPNRLCYKLATCVIVTEQLLIFRLD